MIQIEFQLRKPRYFAFALHDSRWDHHRCRLHPNPEASDVYTSPSCEIHSVWVVDIFRGNVKKSVVLVPTRLIEHTIFLFRCGQLYYTIDKKLLALRRDNQLY